MNDDQWDDLTVGLKHSFAVTLTAEMLATFSALSGDVNPLHVDAGYAASQGFDRPVAFGMLTAAFYSQLVGVHLPGRRALLHGIDIDFSAPALPGDVLSIEGEIVFLSPALRRLEIKARTRNQHGKLISKAKIRVGLLESATAAGSGDQAGTPTDR